MSLQKRFIVGFSCIALAVPILGCGSSTTDRAPNHPTNDDRNGRDGDHRGGDHGHGCGRDDGHHRQGDDRETASMQPCSFPGVTC